MLDIFRKKKPQTKKTYRPKSEEDKLNEQLRKEKQWARSKMLEKAKDNPDLENQYISKLMGIDIKPTNPIEKKKQETKDKIVSRALDKIDQDPELSEKFVEQQISQIMGSSDKEEDNEETFDNDGNPIHRILQQKQDMEELEEQFGGGGGRSTLVKDILDSEFGRVLAGVVAQLFVNATPRAAAPTERVYIVEVPGKGMAEVPESKYRELLQAGQIKPTGVLLEAKTETVSPKPEVKISPPPPDTGPALPKEFDMIDIPMLGAYLTQLPEEVVTQLKDLVVIGDMQSKFLWDFISSTNYDTIVGIIKPYSKNPKVGEYVQQILSPKGGEWSEQVIKLVRENKSEA